jgi:hypothetical protein
MADDQRYSVQQRITHPCGITLYTAQDTETGADVWLWRLYDFDQQHPQPSAELVRVGSETMLAFRHPAAVTTLATYLDPDGLVAALEVPPGTSLDVLAARRVLTAKDLEQIAVPCIEAIMAAHTVQLPHGSIEPGLIFCAENADGTLSPRLLGFGLVELMSGAQGGHFECSQEEDLHFFARSLYVGMGGSSSRDLAVLEPLQKSRPDLPPAVCDWVMNLVHPEPSKRLTRPDVALQHLRMLLGYSVPTTTNIPIADAAWRAAEQQVAQAAAPAQTPADAAQAQAYAAWQHQQQMAAWQAQQAQAHHLHAQQHQQAQAYAAWQHQQQVAAWQQAQMHAQQPAQPQYPAAAPVATPQATPVAVAAPAPSAAPRVELGQITTPLSAGSTTGKLATSTQTSPFGPRAAAPRAPTTQLKRSGGSTKIVKGKQDSEQGEPAEKKPLEKGPLIGGGLSVCIILFYLYYIFLR